MPGLDVIDVADGVFPRLRRVFAYYRAIKQCRPDVVHVHFAHSLGAWLAAATGGRPLVVSTMGADVLFDEQGTNTIFTRQMTRRLLRSADLVTVKSDYIAGIVRDLGGSGTNVTKVAWGVDTRVFFPRDPANLRRRVITLTPKGRARFRKLMEMLRT